MAIYDLLQSKFESEAEERDKADEDEDKKNDWKLAAAVIDRILYVFFSIAFVGGTITFAITVAVVFHY